jgi:hypothetical protein
VTRPADRGEGREPLEVERDDVAGGADLEVVEVVAAVRVAAESETELAREVAGPSSSLSSSIVPVKVSPVADPSLLRCTQSYDVSESWLIVVHTPVSVIETGEPPNHTVSSVSRSIAQATPSVWSTEYT